MRIRVSPIQDNHVRVDLKPNILEFLMLSRSFEERYAVRARCVGRGWEWIWEKTGEPCGARVERAIHRAMAERAARRFA